MFNAIPGSRGAKRPNKLSPREPVPCKVCYAPCKQVGKRWVCERHGVQA